MRKDSTACATVWHTNHGGTGGCDCSDDDNEQVVNMCETGRSSFSFPSSTPSLSLSSDVGEDLERERTFHTAMDLGRTGVGLLLSVSPVGEPLARRCRLRWCFGCGSSCCRSRVCESSSSSSPSSSDEAVGSLHFFFAKGIIGGG